MIRHSTIARSALLAPLFVLALAPTAAAQAQKSTVVAQSSAAAPSAAASSVNSLTSAAPDAAIAASATPEATKAVAPDAAASSNSQGGPGARQEAPAASPALNPSANTPQSAAEDVPSAARTPAPMATESGASVAIPTRAKSPFLPGYKYLEPPALPIFQVASLQVGVTTGWNKDPGYDLFSKNDLSQRISFAIEADITKPTPSTRLGLQLGYAREGSDNGDVPSAVGTSASLSANHLHAGALLSWDLTSWLAMHARVQAGYSSTKAQISRPANFGAGGDASSTKGSAFGGLGAGFTLTSPVARIAKQRAYLNGFSYGLRAEGGYLLASAIRLRIPDQAAAPPERPIAVQGTDLGRLDRKGAFLYLGIFIRL